MLRAQIVTVMWMRDRRARFVAWAKQDDGQERSVETMILLGAAVAMMIAVTVFAVAKLGAAKKNVDEPVKVPVT